MSLKTGRTGLRIPKFPPKGALRVKGTGRLKGTGKVRTANPPKVSTVSTSSYLFKGFSK